MSFQMLISHKLQHLAHYSPRINSLNNACTTRSPSQDSPVLPWCWLYTIWGCMYLCFVYLSHGWMDGWIGLIRSTSVLISEPIYTHLLMVSLNLYICKCNNAVAIFFHVTGLTTSFKYQAVQIYQQDNSYISPSSTKKLWLGILM